ncbi:MAG TPA: hypothetical protein VM900_06060, partial [Sphingomonas sp.]|nr:hypothetical protein [Sphingomonas sp.]
LPWQGSIRHVRDVTAIAFPSVAAAWRLLVLLVALAAAAPAQAAVTMTFWSHELGNSFPHAFVTLRGVPDAGGPAIDTSYGFTAKALTPAILFGTVAGKLEVGARGYIESSDARFSVTLSDDQYARVRALAAAWDAKTGDARYNLNKRNCVHFVKEAARTIGLGGLDHPGLMKKPRSYLLAVAAANRAAIVTLDLPGKAYLATLPPLPAATAATAR